MTALSPQRRVVLDAIVLAGEAGMTAYECSLATGIARGTVARRIADLHALGHVRVAPSMRRTDTGTLALVWRYETVHGPVPERVPPLPKGFTRGMSESDVLARLAQLTKAEVRISHRFGRVRVQWASRAESRAVGGSRLNIALERALRTELQHRNGDALPGLAAS